jgi:hypothetical protein
MTDLFTVQLNSLSNDQLYSAVVEFAQAQPNESNRHDFKLIWTSDAVKDVAAFSNTFGGLLIIGVGKGQGDSQATIIGVTSSSELTTGIASSIATNISPTPSYDISECYKPGETNKRFCVVRIRSASTLHLVTKKGVVAPVFVRNADQTIPADAAQLRGLIDRERQVPAGLDDALIERGQRIMEEMIIGQQYSDAPDWTRVWHRSDTYFKLALVPRELRQIRLDVRDEKQFAALTRHCYRRVASNLGGTSPVARDASNRGGDFYEYRWHHRNLDYEGRWRITNRLDVAHSTQIRVGDKWSLVDVVMYTILSLKLGSAWWKAQGYFGDGILLAHLNVGALQLERGTAGQFMKLFGPAEGDYGMGAEVLEVHALQRSEAQAYLSVSSATILDSIPCIVASVMNPLLRTLGHGVVWDKFEENVSVIVQGQPR